MIAAAAASTGWTLLESIMNHCKRIIQQALLPALLLAASTANAEGTASVTRTDLTGIGLEKGVMRRDPSDIIKVGDLYYVWYSKGKLKTGYDATVWYATSADGLHWTEKGEAVAKG